MHLSDTDIAAALAAGQLVITPAPDIIQPGSVDLHLGPSLAWFSIDDNRIIRDHFPFEVEPGELILASTLERIEIDAGHVGRVEGKSTWARKGLLPHVAAGFIDPGFRGNITLEILNVSKVPILLEPGVAIAQIAFMRLLTPATRPYGSPGLGSHYQDSIGVVASKLGEDA